MAWVGPRAGYGTDAVSDTLPGDFTAAANQPVIAGALNCNHAMALLVMLVMVAKPAAGIAFALLLLAPALGVVSALASRRAMAAADATTDADTSLAA